jgi:colanic acid/amylovoran biosynthesis glycosyltransferase
MKLLLVTSMSPEESSSFIKAQIRYLRPDLILHSGFRPFRCNGSSIFRFPLNISAIRILTKRLLPFLYSRKYRSDLKSFLLKNDFDVILCDFGVQASNIAPACAEANVPLVAHFLGYDAYITTLLKKYHRRYQDMFNTAASFVVVSHDMKEQLVKLGCPANKIVEIPCGFDSTVFEQVKPEKNGNQLIFVGRFTEKKGPLLLVDAFNYALQSFPDATLVMIGDGELYHKVAKRIKELHIERSVKLLGKRTPSDVNAKMKQSRAYVQHSLTAHNGDSEGSPVSIIEAAGSGLPVISTSHAGIKESVIDGKTGFLVPEGDWESMGIRIIELLQDPKLAGEMGREGRKHIMQDFEINRQMDKLRQLLISVSRKSQ